MNKAVALFSVFMVGCTMDGKATGPDTNMACTDTRDGERFELVAHSARNGRIGIGADSCLEAMDTQGRWRTFCSKSELYIKCVPAESSYDGGP